MQNAEGRRQELEETKFRVPSFEFRVKKREAEVCRHNVADGTHALPRASRSHPKLPPEALRKCLEQALLFKASPNRFIFVETANLFLRF